MLSASRRVVTASQSLSRRTTMAAKELTDLAFAFADALKSHDAAALGAIIGADYQNHNPYVARTRGPESAVAFFTDWLEAFPDAEVICEDALGVGTRAEGTVVGRFTYIGTFTRPIMGSHQPASVS